DLPRRLRRLPAAEDRGGREAASDPDGARRRLRVARGMSFRARMTLVAAAAVALAVVVASAVVYVVVRGELRGPVDADLRSRAAYIAGLPPEDIERALFHLQAELGGAGGYPQVVRSDGGTLRPPGETLALPVDRRV